MDGKGESDQFFIDAGVPVTFLLTSFYWENMIYFGMGPQRGADGKLAITYPMGEKKIACISASDIGKCTYGVFKRGEKLIGKRVGIAGEHISCSEMAETLTNALGEPVTYNVVTPEQYRGFGFPGADDLGNMFQFYHDFEKEFPSVRDINYSKELNPEVMSFEVWLSEDVSRLPFA